VVRRRQGGGLYNFAIAHKEVGKLLQQL